MIGQSSGGRHLFGVVVNALETDEQQRDYERWTQLRSIMLTDPARGQALLDQWGDGVKIPIFIEANIHGNEEEGTDAMMQVIRDLVTTPYGANSGRGRPPRPRDPRRDPSHEPRWSVPRDPAPTPTAST